MSSNIVVIGASAGGVVALRHLVSRLPGKLDTAIFVVLHLSPNRPSRLAEILTQCGSLPAHCPEDGEAIQPGRIYVAPPDRHLLIERGRIRLNNGAKVNRARPAIDPLFWTAAEVYGPRVLGIVMTGVLDDGTAGLAAIKARGGIAVVQDPEEAQFPDMPKSALKAVAVDYCLPIAGIANLVANPEQVKAKTSFPASPEVLALEAQISLQGTADIPTLNHLGKPSVYSCPDCHGVLWEIQDGKLLRYRCQTGHAYSARTLLVSQVEDKEDELWMVLRSLEEIEHLSNQLAALNDGKDPVIDVNDFKQIAQQTKEHLAHIRRVLMKKEPMASAIRANKTGPERN